MRKTIIVIFAVFVFSSICCETRQRYVVVDKNATELIIRQCLDKFQKDEPEIKFIVSPKFKEFEFNSFMRQNYATKTDINLSKQQTLDSLDWTEIEFRKVQSAVNDEYLNKYDYDLPKLSNSDIGNWVISFSGINNNLIFVELMYYCDAVRPSDLNEEFFNKQHRIASVDCLNFIIFNNKIKVIPANGVVLEHQCLTSDIQIE